MNVYYGSSHRLHATFHIQNIKESYLYTLTHDSLPHFQEMAINSYDIVSTLQALGMMKYWKGKHIILKKQVCISCLLFS